MCPRSGSTSDKCHLKCSKPYEKFKEIVFKKNLRSLKTENPMINQIRFNQKFRPIYMYSPDGGRLLMLCISCVTILNMLLYDRCMQRRRTTYRCKLPMYATDVRYRGTLLAMCMPVAHLETAIFPQPLMQCRRWLISSPSSS